MSKFTKKEIFTAFSRLISVKPLDSITIRDIVEECGVNRNTFYYYFCDIYALVDELLETEAATFTKDCESVYDALDVLRSAAVMVSENRKSVYHMYNSKKRAESGTRLHSMLFRMFEQPVKREFPRMEADDTALIASYTAYAVSGRMLDWIDGGMKESPDEIIDELKRLFDAVKKTRSIE